MNRLRGPASAMSKTGFKFGDAVLQLSNFSTGVCVALVGNETKVARFVIAVGVNPIQFKPRFIPTRQLGNIRQKGATIFAPSFTNADAATAVTVVTGIIRVAAPINGCGDPIE
jgi:hypothetical protein